MTTCVSRTLAGALFGSVPVTIPKVIGEMNTTCSNVFSVIHLLTICVQGISPFEILVCNITCVYQQSLTLNCKTREYSRLCCWKLSQYVIGLHTIRSYLTYETQQYSVLLNYILLSSHFWQDNDSCAMT